MKNESLHTTFIDVLNSTFPLVLDHLNTDMPKMEVYKIIRLPDGNFKLPELTPVLNSKKFIQELEGKITSSPAFIKFLDRINEDSVIVDLFRRYVDIAFLSRIMTPIDVVVFALARMVDRYDSEKKTESYGVYFDEEIAERTYMDLEQFLYCDTIPIVDVVPIDNFNSDIELAQIQDFTLRKISQDEKELYLQLTRKGVMRVMSWKHVFEFKYHAKKTHFGKDSSDEIQNIRMPNLIQEMRLFKKGLVGYSSLIAKVDLFLPIGNVYTMRDHRELTHAVLPDARPEAPVEDFGNIYLLYNTELTKFQEFQNSMKSVIQNQEKFFLALRRFNYSYSREKVEDKIIDFAISIEALFSKKNDGTDSIAYKLATRISRLWKINDLDYKKIFKDIKNFYDARSKIVHGDSKEREKSLKKVDVDNIDNIIRESLRMYIERLRKNEVSHDGLMELLDFA